MQSATLSHCIGLASGLGFADLHHEGRQSNCSRNLKIQCSNSGSRRMSGWILRLLGRLLDCSALNRRGGIADNRLREQCCQLRPVCMAQAERYPDFNCLAFDLNSYDNTAAPGCLHATHEIPMLILSYLSTEDIRLTFWFDRGLARFLGECLGLETSMVRF